MLVHITFAHQIVTCLLIRIAGRYIYLSGKQMHRPTASVLQNLLRFPDDEKSQASSLIFRRDRHTSDFASFAVLDTPEFQFFQLVFRHD